jgi:glycosyltransferase involved in cell wall biosynthesis
MPNPNIVVDGVIFALNPHGGISRWFGEILPRMADIASPDTFTLLAHLSNRASIPKHPNIRHQVVWPPLEDWLRPRSLWFPLTDVLAPHVKRRTLQPTSQTIWHSSYYTDVANWPGKKVVSVADLIQEQYPQYYGGAFQDGLRRRIRQQIQAADAVICISQATAQAVQDRYHIPDERIHIIPLGVSSLFQPLTNVSMPASPFLLYVGGRGGYKDFSTVLTAYQRWSGRASTQLVVVGGQWTQQERAAVAPLSGRVVLLTGVSDSALLALYNQASGFIISSHVEGFGLPVLEALACGCPVVASDIPTTKEVAADVPLYFTAGQADSLVEALDQLPNWTDTRRKKGYACASKYVWAVTARQTFGVYAELQM